MNIIKKPTRFRAYQLDKPGSLYSYYDGERFTLIEAVLTDPSIKSLINELYVCGKTKIDTLHITSWDNDHCEPNALAKILTHFEPKIIEHPGYNPHTISGQECFNIIARYKRSSMIKSVEIGVYAIGPQLIRGVQSASSFANSDVFCSPWDNYENLNDNSVVKLFRSGSFTVASLGDVESSEISEYLLNNQIFQNEVDVMILAHHGADNGFTTDRFIKAVKPRVAICGSNYGNQYEHPKQEIKNLLYQNGVLIFTTKTGDVIVSSNEDDSNRFKVINLISDSTQKSSEKIFYTKKSSHYSAAIRSMLNL